MSFSDDDLQAMWPMIPRSVPMPKLLHSLEFDGPFTQCTICSGTLAEFDDGYVIQRVFSGDEPIFEMALCMNCRDNVGGELSQETRLRVEACLRGRIDVEARADRLRDMLDDDVENWVGECLLTGTPWSDCRVRSVAAICHGNELQLRLESPIMLSDVAAEELSELISEESQKSMDDFVGDNFGLPPEFCDAPDLAPLLM